MQTLIRKHEQVFDALENDRVTPKKAEQLNQALKGIMGIPRLELQYLNTLLKFGRKVPVPRSPVLRAMLGLPDEVTPEDGEKVRILIGAK